MARHIHLDPVGGVAGDMFAAALADAFPEAAAAMSKALSRAGFQRGVSCRVVAHRDHALTGKRFDVADKVSHDHTPYRAVRTRLEKSRLPDGARKRALAIYALLAEVEGKVHGIATEKVTFHELGGWDSIVDVSAAALMIEAVGPATWSVGPLPLGSGRVRSAHGLLPVPAPATALLLKGFATMDDGIPGERVTPTGAAILKHLQCAGGMGGMPRRLAATGIGFGTRTLPGISNVLRALVFEEAAGTAEWNSDRVAQIEFEIDDQTPEDLAVGLDRLRALSGVIDVTQSPAIGKKGRLAAHVRVLCATGKRDAVIAACFTETTTLGLRVQTVERAVLPRESLSAPGGMTVKRARRPGGGVTAKAEIDQVADKGGAAERDAARSRAADAVIAGASGLRRRR